MISLGGQSAFIRMLGSGVIIQALLSASNFVIGVLLVSHTS